MLKLAIYFLNTLLRWRKFIFSFMLVVAILVSALMLIVPKTFNSYAMIQPVTASESSGILGVLSGLTGGGTGNQSEAGLMLSILESRSLLESVVDEFDLMQIYEADIREELVRGLRDDYQITLTDEGAIHLSFAAHTDWFVGEAEEGVVRARAQNILDFIIQYLDEQNVFLKTQSSRFQREFLERRFQSALVTLDSLETELTDFEKETGIVALDAQLEGKILIATELKKQLVAIETEYFVASRSLSPDNPKLKELRLVRAAILGQIKKSENRDRNSDTFILDQMYPPFALIPDLSIRFKHIEMELKTHFKILEFLGTQLEEAKLGEAKDTPTIQIIDLPSLPELRSSPQRTITVLVTVAIAFLMIISLIYIIESYSQADNNSENRSAMKELKATFLSVFSAAK